MAKLKRLWEYEGQIVYAFRCKGCKDRVHAVRLEGPHAWTWNGSLDKPTIQPSIKTWSKNDGSDTCHSFVTDGKIQYLGDCFHELKGQTVELPEWWGEGWEDETD